MGSGWIAAIVALGCAFAGWQHVSAWTAATGPVTGAPGNPHHPTASAAPLLLLFALALTGISLLTAL